MASVRKRRFISIKNVKHNSPSNSLVGVLYLILDFILGKASNTESNNATMLVWTQIRSMDPIRINGTKGSMLRWYFFEDKEGG
jgi:hypothetical protein